MKISAYVELLAYLLALTYSYLLIDMPLNRMLHNYQYISVVLIFYLILIVYMIALSRAFVRSFFMKNYRANGSFKIISITALVVVLPYTFVKFRELLNSGGLESKLFIGLGLALIFFSIFNFGKMNHHAFK